MSRDGATTSQGRLQIDNSTSSGCLGVRRLVDVSDFPADVSLRYPLFASLNTLRSAARMLNRVTHAFRLRVLRGSIMLSITMLLGAVVTVHPSRGQTKKAGGASGPDGEPTKGGRTGCTEQNTPEWSLRSPEESRNGYFGSAIHQSPDVDGDNRADIIVGASRETPGEVHMAGQAYLIGSTDGKPLYEYVSPNPEPNGQLGGAVAPVGDLTGDSVPEVLIGAPGESAMNEEGSGRVYLFDGRGRRVLLSILSPAAEKNGEFGTSVAVLDPFRSRSALGPRRARIAVSGPGESTDPGGEEEPTGKGEGQVHILEIRSERGGGLRVVHNKTIGSPDQEPGGRFGASIALSDPTGVAGQQAATNELLIGALETAGGKRRAGRVYLIDAGTQEVRDVVTSPDPRRNGQFGAAVAPVGRYNGLGRRSFFVGAPVEGTGQTKTAEGNGYLIDQSTLEVIRTVRSPLQETNGFFGIAAGQINEDEARTVDGEHPAVDLLVGSSESSNGRRSSGWLFKIDLRPACQ